MTSKLRKYFPFFKANMMSVLSYRFNIVVWIIVTALEVMASLFLWIAVYKSSLADDVTMNTAIGGFKEGTKVSDLKNKAFSTILDKLLFPVSVRDLVQPYIVSNVVS